MSEVLHFVVNDGPDQGAEVYYISDGSTVAHLTIPANRNGVELNNTSAVPLEVRVQQSNGNVSTVTVPPGTTYIELRSESDTGSGESGSSYTAAHDPPIEHDPWGQFFVGLLFTGIESAVEGVGTGALKLVGALTGEAGLTIAESGDKLGPGLPGLGSGRGLEDTPVYVGELGDAIDVHDLPDAPVPTVGVHSLPDAPIDVHDLPDASPDAGDGSQYLGEADDPGFVGDGNSSSPDSGSGGAEQPPDTEGQDATSGGGGDQGDNDNRSSDSDPP